MIDGVDPCRDAMKCRAIGCPNEATLNLIVWPLCAGCDLVRHDLARQSPCKIHQKRSCNYCMPQRAGRRSPPKPIDVSRTCTVCGAVVVGGVCTGCRTHKKSTLAEVGGPGERQGSDDDPIRL
jgi:hypothetical protein